MSFIMAFMGNDGSGKTTNAKAIHELLGRHGMKTIYVEEYEYFLLKYVLRLLALLGRKRQATDAFAIGEKNRLYYIWIIMIYFDLLLERIYLRVFYRDHVIIFDRYAYDLLQSHRYLGYKNKVVEKMYKNFPRPDLGLVFHVDPKTAYERRADSPHDMEFYRIQTERYRNFADELDFPTINTSNDIKKTTDVALSHLRSALINELPREDMALLNAVLDDKTQVPEEFHKYVKSNGLAGYLSSRNQMEPMGDFDARILQDTIDYLDRRLESHFFIKTFSSEYVYPDDLDVFLREETIESAIRKLDVSNVSDHKFHRATEVDVVGMVEIDLHDEISWQGFEPLSVETWLTENVEVQDRIVEVPTPSIEAAILISHDLYQNHFTRFRDFLSLTHLLKNCSTDPRAHLRDPSSCDKFLSWIQARTLILLGEPMDIPSNGTARVGVSDVYSKLLYYHPLCWIPRDTGLQKLDFLLTILRKWRYRLWGILPY